MNIELSVLNPTKAAQDVLKTGVQVVDVDQSNGTLTLKIPSTKAKQSLTRWMLMNGFDPVDIQDRYSELLR